MSETQAPEPEAAPAAEEVVHSFKGMDANMQCRGHQFEVGKTYELTGDIKACSHGFHACEHPLSVFEYYSPASSRFFATTQSGQIARHGSDTKVASAKITIDAELRLPEFIAAAVNWVIGRCTPEGEAAKGDRGAASSTGDQGAASSTGCRGAASSTGDWGAASSTGYQGAASSTGDWGAASSTGYRGAASSTGYRGAASSTGYRGAASSMGFQGAASSTGYRGAASSTGDQGAASSTGDQGAASSTGDQGAASSTGDQGAAMASGHFGKVMGADGNALFLVYRKQENGSIEHAWAGVVGQNGIKPGVWYSLDKDGAPQVAA